MYGDLFNFMGDHGRRKRETGANHSEWSGIKKNLSLPLPPPPPTRTKAAGGVASQKTLRASPKALVGATTKKPRELAPRPRWGRPSPKLRELERGASVGVAMKKPRELAPRLLVGWPSRKHRELEKGGAGSARARSQRTQTRADTKTPRGLCQPKTRAEKHTEKKLLGKD